MGITCLERHQQHHLATLICYDIVCLACGFKVIHIVWANKRSAEYCCWRFSITLKLTYIFDTMVVDFSFVVSEDLEMEELKVDLEYISSITGFTMDRKATLVLLWSTWRCCTFLWITLFTLVEKDIPLDLCN